MGRESIKLAKVDSILDCVTTTLNKDELAVKRQLKAWLEEYSPDLMER